MNRDLVPRQPSESDFIVARLDKARTLLAEARDAKGAKRVADLAHIAEVYARRQKLSEEAIAAATAIKVDALTLMGEYLQATPKNPGTRGQLNGREPSGSSRLAPPEDAPPTLAAQGLPDKKVNAAAQILAKAKLKAPELHEKVRSGKTTVAKVRAELNRQERRERLEARAEEVKAAPPANTWRIVTGDCLTILPTIEPGTVRLAFADPPYNQGVDYGSGAKQDLLPYREFLGWCLEWMKGVAAALTPDGSFWVLISDEYAAEFAMMLGTAGLHRRQWLVWYESFGVNCANKFNRTHRHLFWCVKDARRFVFHPEAVTRPSDRQAKYDDPRANPDGKTWDSVWGINPPIPRLVENARERLPDFPTQLPVALLTAVVGCASNPGDLVLDPFSSSGTTGAACLRLGRRYLGVEKNPQYAELSRKRLLTERTQQ